MFSATCSNDKAPSGEAGLDGVDYETGWALQDIALENTRLKVASRSHKQYIVVLLIFARLKLFGCF